MGRAFVWVRYNGRCWPSLWPDGPPGSRSGKDVTGEIVGIWPLPDEHANLTLDDLAKLYPQPEASPNVPIKIKLSDPGKVGV